MPMHPWYVENHIEYLIRYLGHKYFMEQAFCAQEPYKENVRKDPLRRNPDDYDLLIPLRPTYGHTGVADVKKYAHKLAYILWEPNEGQWNHSLINACTTPIAAKSMKRAGHPYVQVCPGIDTRLFAPYKLEKNRFGRLIVGVIGCPHNPRHRISDVVMPLLELEKEGIEFRFFVRNWSNKAQDVEVAGGKKFYKRIYSGNKRWIGVPNVYNSIDVLLKVDFDPGLTFPILEAAACEVPVVTTNVGIEDDFRSAGIVLDADEKDLNGNGREWYRKNIEEMITRFKYALMFMLEYPEERKKMGKKGRQIVLQNYTWEKQLPKWEEFFEKAFKLQQKIKDIEEMSVYGI